MIKITLPMKDNTNGKLSELVIAALKNGATSERIDAATFSLSLDNEDDAKAIRDFIAPKVVEAVVEAKVEVKGKLKK